MDERRIEREGVSLFARVDGPEDPAAPTIVFANSLGTDIRLWDALLPLLPDGLRLIRWDKRGHGRSSVPPAPYAMGALVSDAEAVCDAFEVRDCVFVGLSIGGLIAQGLAVKRPDLMRGLVLSNTGAKIGTPQLWEERIAAIRRGGLEAIADGVMERWFAKGFRESPDVKPWRELLVSTPLEGYVGCAAAIAGTDFWTTTASLTLPTLGIAGSEDGATPPDLVRETVALVEGSRFELIRGAGHLPCVERPEAYAAVLNGFLAALGVGEPRPASR